MFTVGIFSTHLPYIAFVIFYALFFLFGIQKAAAGEFNADETFKKSTTVIASDIKSPAANKIFSAQDHYFNHLKLTDLKLSPFDNPTFFLHNNEQIKQISLSYSQFCRPPPLTGVWL